MIAVCMPMARGAHPLTQRCLLNLDVPRPFLYTDPVGLQVDNARNAMTGVGLAYRDVTHLMFIDDDMTFPRDGLRRLLAHDLPIVGGLCHNRRPPYPPILIHDTPRGFLFQYDYPEGLVEVDATGGAFLLVKREVFEAVRAKFPSEEPWAQAGVSEDVSFCRRAKAAGFKVFVDTTLKIGHIGEVVVDEAFGARNREYRAYPWHAPKPPPKGPPVASIVIPTYNQRPEFLRAAVESALAQTVPVEVIVVDDGSDVEMRREPRSVEEHLAALLGQLDMPQGHRIPKSCDEAAHAGRLRTLRPPHRGCYPSLNTGIRAMTTDYFVWLSSDDLLYPDKVEVQLRAMEEQREVCSFAAYDVIVGGGGLSTNIVTPYKWKSIDEQRRILSTCGCAVHSPTPMVHRSALEAVQLPNGDFFNAEEFPIVADFELWTRLAQRFYWLPVAANLSTRREHAGNDSTRFQLDPVKRTQWLREDAEVRRRYAVEEP